MNWAPIFNEWWAMITIGSITIGWYMKSLSRRCTLASMTSSFLRALVRGGGSLMTYTTLRSRSKKKMLNKANNHQLLAQRQEISILSIMRMMKLIQTNRWDRHLITVTTNTCPETIETQLIETEKTKAAGIKIWIWWVEVLRLLLQIVGRWSGKKRQRLPLKASAKLEKMIQRFTRERMCDPGPTTENHRADPSSNLEWTKGVH